MRLAIVLLLSSLSFAQGMGGKSGIGGKAGFGGGAPSTAFTFINAASNACVAATCAVTYSPTSGNLVISDIECSDGTAADNPTLTTDNGTSTWANAFAAGQQSGGWYYNEDYTLSAAGSPTTITAHCGASTTNTGVDIREYHRPSGSWVFGGVPGTLQAFGSGTTATCNAVTPTGGVAALVSGFFISENQSVNAWTNGNSTIRINQVNGGGNDLNGAGEQLISSASGSFTASANMSVSVSWRCFGSWYK